MKELTTCEQKNKLLKIPIQYEKIEDPRLWAMIKAMDIHFELTYQEYPDKIILLDQGDVWEGKLNSMPVQIKFNSNSEIVSIEAHSESDSNLQIKELNSRIQELKKLVNLKEKEINRLRTQNHN